MRRPAPTAIGVVVGMALVITSLAAAREVGDAMRSILGLARPVLLVPVVALTGVVFLADRVVVRERPWRTRIARALGGLRRRGTAVPAGLALPVLVGLAAALQISLNDATSMPRVFGDELIFADLAKSFAEHGRLVVRGVTDNGHSVLYPALIGPAYALADDGVQAFRLVQVLNALAFALTAVPAYYLARRVVSHGWSLAVAVLSVSIPATAYSALVMTESFFYPAFTTAALVLTLTLERPTVSRQLLTAALLLTLVAIRTQALLLVPAITTAVILDGALSGSLRRRLAAFWPTWLVLALVLAGALVASRAGADAPTGAYGPLLRFYAPVELAKWAIWSSGAFALSLGVVAVGAVPLALAGLLRRAAPQRERAFGAATTALLVWVLASVAVLSASPYGLDILHERSLFFATPVVLTCLAYWLAGGLRRSLVLSVAVAAALVAFAAALPERLVVSPTTIDAPTNVVWLGLSERISAVPTTWFVVATAVVGASVLTLARAGAAPLLSVVLASVFVIAGLQWRPPLTREQTDRLGWIDQALPRGAHATIVHVSIDMSRCPGGAQDYQPQAVVWSEFFNRSVDRVYNVLGQVVADGLASPTLTIAEDGTLSDDAGPVEAEYAAVDSRVRLYGTPLAVLDLHEFPGFAATAPGSLTLWRPERPLRLVFPQPLLDGRPERLACPTEASPQ
jgi:hypothetical protein